LPDDDGKPAAKMLAAGPSAAQPIPMHGHWLCHAMTAIQLQYGLWSSN
jgi:hypothetical protein